MRRIPSFTTYLKAWRQVGSLVRLPRGRVLFVALLGAVIGFTESALLGILASVGVAIAGDDTPTIKLPLLALEGLSIPAMIGIGVGLAIATLAAQFLNTVQVARIYADVVSGLRRGCYRDFSQASWRVQRAEVDSTFVNYIVFHVPRTANLVAAVIGQLVASITLVVFIAGAVLISPAISLVVIVLGVLLFLGFLPVRGIARRAGVESQTATRALFASLVEAVAASREIKAYGVEDPVRERINDEIDDLERPAFRVRVASGFVPVLYQRLVFLILLGGVALVYFLDIKDVGAIGASMLIILRAMQQAQHIQAADPVISESLPWVGELVEAREGYRLGSVAYGDVALTGIDEIEFKDVTYAYADEGPPALDRVSFSARRGDLIGVIGPSGSGKSTLSELIVRLDAPQSGSYLVNGRPATDYDQASWAAQVVLVPQMGRLITGSIADNIRFLRTGVSDDEVRRASDQAHLTEDVLEFEEGFTTLVGERGHRGLSGGQRQRLSIARAVAVPPGLIVFDEPTSALDHKAEGVIVETIEALRHNACVIVIAHRLSTLRHCDRVLVLREGKTEAFCAPDELAEASEFFRSAGTTLAP